MKRNLEYLPIIIIIGYNILICKGVSEFQNSEITNSERGALLRVFMKTPPAFLNWGYVLIKLFPRVNQVRGKLLVPTFRQHGKV